MTKEELEKLQKDPLWKAHKIVGRDANGKLVMEEITAQECAETTHENFVYKHPDDNDCAVKPLGAERTSKRGLVPNPKAATEVAPEPKPTPAPTPPLKTYTPETVLQQFAFGADFSKEELEAAGFEILADNTKKDLSEGVIETTGHTTPKPPTKSGNCTKTGTKNWLYVERALKKGNETWLATNQQKILRYMGTKNLVNVGKLELHPLAMDRIAKTKDGLRDEDIINIVPNTLGNTKNKEVFMGCYAITIKTNEGFKTKIGKHCDMAGWLQQDLTRSPSLNFRTDIKTYGLHGVQINISRAFADEEECKEHKRGVVKKLRERGWLVYNNEETATDGFETVKEYKAVTEFAWAANGVKSAPVKSDNLLNDLWKCYEENSGKENGMVFLLK